MRTFLRIEDILVYKSCICIVVILDFSGHFYALGGSIEAKCLNLWLLMRFKNTLWDRFWVILSTSTFRIFYILVRTFLNLFQLWDKHWNQETCLGNRKIIHDSIISTQPMIFDLNCYFLYTSSYFVFQYCELFQMWKSKHLFLDA